MYAMRQIYGHYNSPLKDRFLMQPSPSRIDFNELINACIERVLWIFSILRNLIVQWNIIVVHMYII